MTDATNPKLFPGYRPQDRPRSKTRRPDELNSKPGQVNIFMPAAILVGVILISSWLYLPPYHNAFLGDDYKHLQYINAFLNAPWRAYQIFDPFWLGWYYRPLQQFTIFLERLAFGFDPFGYYAVQIGLHALVVALLYRVSRQWGLSRFAAVAAAAIFAIRGHHQDVVGWISSMANIQAGLFSLVALSSYLSYRRQRKRSALLVLAVCAALLALLAHEEGILLPIFMALVWSIDEDCRPTTRSERIAFGLLLLAVALYVWLQLVRPNWTIEIRRESATEWLQLFSWKAISLYLTQLFFRYSALSAEQFDWLLRAQYGFTIAAGGVIALLAIWYRTGRRVVRLGLLWAALHLAFIYATLWSNKPEFFAGRHLYIAGLGLAWALGGTLARLPALPYNDLRTTRALLGLAIVAGMIVQSSLIREGEKQRLARTEELAQFAAELKRVMPAFTPDTHLFIHDFPMDPTFVAAAVSAWYRVPVPYPYLGGSLDDLSAHGRATKHFYAFDHDGGTIQPIMPELQAATETVFVWSEEPGASFISVEGSTTALDEALYQPAGLVELGGDQRLALTLLTGATEGWSSLAYPFNIPRRSEFRVALGDPDGGLTFRIRLKRATGDVTTLFRARLTPDQIGRWTEISLPTAPYWGEEVILYLEVQGAAAGQDSYWANPRLVID